LDFKIVFIQTFLKTAPIRVWCNTGFPPGAGFPGEEFALITAGVPKNPQKMLSRKSCSKEIRDSEVRLL
jgi:hypothetical protein